MKKVVIFLTVIGALALSACGGSKNNARTLSRGNPSYAATNGAGQPAFNNSAGAQGGQFIQLQINPQSAQQYASDYVAGASPAITVGTVSAIYFNVSQNPSVGNVSPLMASISNGSQYNVTGNPGTVTIVIVDSYSAAQGGIWGSSNLASGTMMYSNNGAGTFNLSFADGTQVGSPSGSNQQNISGESASGSVTISGSNSSVEPLGTFTNANICNMISCY